MQSRMLSLSSLILLLALLFTACDKKAEQLATTDAPTSVDKKDRKILYYKDPMHPWLTSPKPAKAPDCGMDMVPVYEGDSNEKGIKIDPVVVQNIGVKVEDVVKRKLNKSIRAVGKIDYDERRVYSVNSKIMGWVEVLQVDYTGKRVRKGEPLMELYSPELVSTQEEYLQALRYRKKLGSNSLEEARKGSDDLIESAKRRLLYWDIPLDEITSLEQRGAPNKTMTIYSPVDGVVIEKMVQKGQNIMAGMELYKIADLSTVWVLAEVYQYELPWVKVGGPVDIDISYLAGRSFKGAITYIYPYLSMETKTVKVRVEVKNTPAFELKPDMYATVKISSPVSIYDVAVPEEAIIRSGERNIAVMALGGGYFDPREITLGISANGYVQVLDGIKAGEKIVVSSQFLIDSESNLKAAVSQMTGHAGMDMSKPMDKGKATGTEHQEHQMADTSTSTTEGGHDGHDMKDEEAVETAKFIDPVCGMEADQNEALSLTYDGKKYYFCSSEDLEKFKADPAKYVDQLPQQ